MIENLEINVVCVSDDCFSIQIFGRGIEVVRDYSEAEEFIEEFCEEWDIDTGTLVVNDL